MVIAKSPAILLEIFGHDHSVKEVVIWQGDVMEEIIGLQEGGELATELFRKMNGSNGRFWVNETRKLFAGALMDKPTPVPAQVVRVIIGGYRNIADFREDFQARADKKKIIIGRWAMDLTKSPEFVLSGNSTEVDLAIVTPEEMGFTEQPMLRDVYWRATLIWKLGECRSEIGPAMRLKIRQKDKVGDRVLIGMPPIVDSEGKPRIFSVECDMNGNELLDATRWKAEHLYGLKEKFAFELHPSP